jgi:2-oxo-hept-3-ene-1,7-dioate hydratase
MALTQHDIGSCVHRLHQAKTTRTEIWQLSQDFSEIKIAEADYGLYGTVSCTFA